jgi:hypothetical protein
MTMQISITQIRAYETWVHFQSSGYTGERNSFQAVKEKYLNEIQVWGLAELSDVFWKNWKTTW